MKEAIRVLLVGGNEATREELSQMLDSEEGITVVGTAGSEEEALGNSKEALPWRGSYAYRPSGDQV